MCMLFSVCFIFSEVLTLLWTRQKQTEYSIPEFCKTKTSSSHRYKMLLCLPLASTTMAWPAAKVTFSCPKNIVCFAKSALPPSLSPVLGFHRSLCCFHSSASPEISQPCSRQCFEISLSRRLRAFSGLKSLSFQH